MAARIRASTERRLHGNESLLTPDKVQTSSDDRERDVLHLMMKAQVASRGASKLLSQTHCQSSDCANMNSGPRSPGQTRMTADSGASFIFAPSSVCHMPKVIHLLSLTLAHAHMASDSEI